MLFFHDARNHVGWKWKIQSIIWRHPKYPDVWHHVDKIVRWFKKKFSLFHLKYVLVSSSYQRGKHAQVTFLRKWVPGGIKNSKRQRRSEDHGYCTCKTLRTIKSFELLQIVVNNNLPCYDPMLPTLTVAMACFHIKNFHRYSDVH